MKNYKRTVLKVTVTIIGLGILGLMFLYMSNAADNRFNRAITGQFPALVSNPSAYLDNELELERAYALAALICWAGGLLMAVVGSFLIIKNRRSKK